jgi:hypothetical protein
VTETLKNSGDLRAAGRGARQVVQLAYLFRQERSGEERIAALCSLGNAAAAVATSALEAIQTYSPQEAKNAVKLFRAADTERRKIEMELRTPDAVIIYSPTMLRMMRAAAWSFSVSAETMARVAVRLLVPTV